MDTSSADQRDTDGTARSDTSGPPYSDGTEVAEETHDDRVASITESVSLVDFPSLGALCPAATPGWQPGTSAYRRPSAIGPKDAFGAKGPVAVELRQLKPPTELNIVSPIHWTMHETGSTHTVVRPVCAKNADTIHAMRRLAEGGPVTDASAVSDAAIAAIMDSVPLAKANFEPPVGIRDVRLEFHMSKHPLNTVVHPTFQTANTWSDCQDLAEFGLLLSAEHTRCPDSERRDYILPDGRARVRKAVEALTPGAMEGVALAMDIDREMRRVEFGVIPLIWPLFGWAFDYRSLWSYPFDHTCAEGLLLLEVAKWHVAYKAVFKPHIDITTRLHMLYGVSLRYLSWRAAVAANVPGSCVEVKIMDWRRVLEACPIQVDKPSPDKHVLAWTLTSVRKRHSAKIKTAPQWMVNQTARNRYALIDLWAKHMPVVPAELTAVVRLEDIGPERIELNRHAWLLAVFEAARTTNDEILDSLATRCTMLAGQWSTFRVLHYRAGITDETVRRVKPVVRSLVRREYDGIPRNVIVHNNKEWVLRLRSACNARPFPNPDSEHDPAAEGDKLDRVREQMTGAMAGLAEARRVQEAKDQDIITEAEAFLDACARAPALRGQPHASSGFRMEENREGETSRQPPPSKPTMETTDEETHNAKQQVQQFLEFIETQPRSMGAMRLPRDGFSGPTRYRQSPVDPPVSALRAAMGMADDKVQLAEDVGALRRGMLTPHTQRAGPVSTGPVGVPDEWLYTENVVKAEHGEGVDGVTLHERGRQALASDTTLRPVGMLVEWANRKTLGVPWTDAKLTTDKNNVSELFEDAVFGSGTLGACIVPFERRHAADKHGACREAWLFFASPNGRVLRVHSENFPKSKMRQFFDREMLEVSNELTLLVEDSEYFAGLWAEVFGDKVPLAIHALFDAGALMRHAFFTVPGEGPLVTPLTTTLNELLTRTGTYYHLDCYPRVLKEGEKLGTKKDEPASMGEEIDRVRVVSNIMAALVDMVLLVVGARLIKTTRGGKNSSAADALWTQGKLQLQGFALFGGTGPTGAGSAAKVAEMCDKRALASITQMVGNFRRRIKRMESYLSEYTVDRLLTNTMEEINGTCTSALNAAFRRGKLPESETAIAGVRGYLMQRALLGEYDDPDRRLLRDTLDLLEGGPPVSMKDIHNGSYARANAMTMSEQRKKTVELLCTPGNGSTPAHLLARDLALCDRKSETHDRIPVHHRTNEFTSMKLRKYAAGCIDTALSTPEVTLALGSASLPLVVGDSVGARLAYEEALVMRTDHYRTPACETPDKPPLVPQKLAALLTTEEWTERPDGTNTEVQSRLFDKKTSWPVHQPTRKLRVPCWAWPADLDPAIKLRPRTGEIVKTWTSLAEMGQLRDQRQAMEKKDGTAHRRLMLYAPPGQAVVGLRAPLTGPECDMMARIAELRRLAMVEYEKGDEGLMSGLRLDSARNALEIRLHLTQSFRVHAWQVATTPPHVREWDTRAASPMALMTGNREEDRDVAVQSLGFPAEEFAFTDARSANMSAEQKWQALESRLQQFHGKLVVQACAAVNRFGGSSAWWNARAMTTARTAPEGGRMMFGVLSPAAREMDNMLIERNTTKMKEMCENRDTAASIAAGLEILSGESTAALRHARHLVASLETVSRRVNRVSMELTCDLERESPLLMWTAPVGATVEGALIAARDALYHYGVDPADIDEIITKAKMESVEGHAVMRTRRSTLSCTNAQVADIVAATLGSTQVDIEATIETAVGVLVRLASVDGPTAQLIGEMAKTLTSLASDKAEQFTKGELKNRLLSSIGAMRAHHVVDYEEACTTTEQTEELRKAAKEAFADMAMNDRHRLATEDNTPFERDGSLVSCRLSPSMRKHLPPGRPVRWPRTRRRTWWP